MITLYCNVLWIALLTDFEYSFIIMIYRSSKNFLEKNMTKKFVVVVIICAVIIIGAVVANGMMNNKSQSTVAHQVPTANQTNSSGGPAPYSYWSDNAKAATISQESACRVARAGGDTSC